MARQLSPDVQRALIQAAAIDAVCVLAGVGLFVVTGNWIWLVSGVLLGAGFLVPAIIKMTRSGK
ncbi:MAG: hypothetical protein AAF253_13325 [Pseudomonadota bacterium]